MRKKRIKPVVKVASSNAVKSYRLKQGTYQIPRVVKYVGMSHNIQLKPE